MLHPLLYVLERVPFPPHPYPLPQDLPTDFSLTSRMLMTLMTLLEEDR